MAKQKSERIISSTPLSNSETIAHRKPWNSSVRIDQSLTTYQVTTKPKRSRYNKEHIKPLSLDEVSKSGSMKSRAWCLSFASPQRDQLRITARNLNKPDLSDLSRFVDEKTVGRDLTDDPMTVADAPTLKTTPKTLSKQQKEQSPSQKQDTRRIPSWTESPNLGHVDKKLPDVTTEDVAENLGIEFNRLVNACADFENLISRICVWYVKARTAIDAAHDCKDECRHKKLLYPLITDYLNQLQTLLGTCLPSDLCINRSLQAKSTGNEFATGLVSNHPPSSVVFVEQINPQLTNTSENPKQTDENSFGFKHIENDKTDHLVDVINMDPFNKTPMTTRRQADITNPWVTVQSTQTPGVDTVTSDQTTQLHCVRGDINTNCYLECYNTRPSRYQVDHTQPAFADVEKLSPLPSPINDEINENTNGNNLSSFLTQPRNSFFRMTEHNLYTNENNFHFGYPVTKEPEHRDNRIILNRAAPKANRLRFNVSRRMHNTCYAFMEWEIHEIHSPAELINTPYHGIVEQTSPEPVQNALVYHTPVDTIIQNIHRQDPVILVEAVPMYGPNGNWADLPVGTYDIQQFTNNPTMTEHEFMLEMNSHDRNRDLVFGTLPAPPEEFIRGEYGLLNESDLSQSVYNDKFELDCLVPRRSGKRPNTPYLLWKCATTRTDSSLNDYVCSVALLVRSRDCTT